MSIYFENAPEEGIKVQRGVTMVSGRRNVARFVGGVVLQEPGAS